MLEEVLLESHVVVGQQNELARRFADAAVNGFADAAVDGFAEPPILLIDEKANVRKSLPDHRARVIGRGVVNHDDLESLERLPPKRLKTSLQQLSAVPARDNDGHAHIGRLRLRFRCQR